MKKLKWNDPDPIEGNNYIIDTVEGVRVSTILEVLSVIDQKKDIINLSDTAEYPLNITYGGASQAVAVIGELEEVELEEELDHDDDLEHAVLNQIEADFESDEYESLSETLKQLLKTPVSKKILIEYLSDTARDIWVEGKTTHRY